MFFDTDKHSTYFLTTPFANARDQVKAKVINDAVNDAVIHRLKSELMDIIINKGMSLSHLMANYTIRLGSTPDIECL